MNIQQVQTIIADAMEKHNGIVKKEELTRLGIDYRRIDKLVRDGKLVRIRNGYYTDRVDDFSEDALVAALFPDAMLCMESALYAYGYIRRSLTDGRLPWTKTHQNRVLRWTIPESSRFIRSPQHLRLEPQPLSLEAIPLEFMIKSV